MPDNYTNFLAAKVLNDESIVTYRSLSRSLGVHNNVAKRILFSFHAEHNAKQSGSIRATYLVLGVKRTQVQDCPDAPVEEDTHMQSSPYMSSLAPVHNHWAPVIERVATLVREEDLESLKESYETISSIHVYSLQSNTLQNLQVLSDISKEISIDEATGGNAEKSSYSGSIYCPYVERRAGVKPLATGSFANLAGHIKSAGATIASKRLDSLQDGTEGDSPERRNSSTNAKQTLNASGGRKENSSFFSAFTKSKKPLEKTEQSLLPEVSLIKQADDTGDEMDSNSDNVHPSISTNHQDAASDSRYGEKQERQKKLREMMEDENPREEDVQKKSAESDVNENDTVESAGGAEQAATMIGRRRRGRRRIVKKTKTKDADGFLVTREEPGWESFSEDEPQVQTKTKTTNTSTKAKKTIGKGSGNIMSFFGKK